MNKAQAIEVAKSYFPNYPSVNEFHITCDAQAFEALTNAETHANTFKKEEDSVVFSVTREEAENYVEDKHGLKKAASVAGKLKDVLVSISENGLQRTLENIDAKNEEVNNEETPGEDVEKEEVKNEAPIVAATTATTYGKSAKEVKASTGNKKPGTKKAKP